jgi:site-specific DNA-methyltransferase (adenine-specific)
MPLKVMENIIGLLPEEYIIVDPFAGTGTTGVACENLNRDYILIEKDIEYCRIAREKIKQTKNKLPLNKII